MMYIIAMHDEHTAIASYEGSNKGSKTIKNYYQKSLQET